VVVDAGPKNTMHEDTRRSERRSVPINSLTEPALLEMSGYATNQELVMASLWSGNAQLEILCAL